LVRYRNDSGHGSIQLKLKLISVPHNAGNWCTRVDKWIVPRGTIRLSADNATSVPIDRVRGNWCGEAGRN
jgi:hypothetical protein